METINFTNSKPIERKVTNVSKITFRKCLVNKGIENKGGLGLTIEFKTPIGYNDPEGNPLYSILARSLLIGIKVGVMDKPNSNTIKINRYLNVPAGCTIINLSAKNSLNTEFDFDLETIIN